MTKNVFSEKKHSLEQIVLLVISHIICSLDYNPLTRINNRHKRAFSVKDINVYHIYVKIIVIMKLVS